MCGIAGYSGKKSNGMRIKLLTLDNMVRGTHSTGIFSFDKEKGSSEKVEYRGGLLHKSASDAKEFFMNIEDHSFLDKNTIVLSHTRQATVGDKTARNAHPFPYGRVVGTHNGWLLSSIKELSEKFSIPEEVSSTMEVDSEVIVHLLSTANTAEESISKIANLEGAMALAYSFKDPKMGRVLCLYKRTSKPLYLGNEDNGIYYSSREEGLKLCGCKDIRKVDDDSFLIFKEGNLLKSIKIKDPHEVKNTIIKEDEGPTSYKSRITPAPSYYNGTRALPEHNNYSESMSRVIDYRKNNSNVNQLGLNPNNLSLFDYKNVLAYNSNQIIASGYKEFAFSKEEADSAVYYKIDEVLMPKLESEKYGCINLTLNHSYNSDVSFYAADNYRVFVENMPFINNITRKGETSLFFNSKTLKNSRIKQDGKGYYLVPIIILNPRIGLSEIPFKYLSHQERIDTMKTFYTVNVKVRLGFRTEIELDLNILDSTKKAFNSLEDEINNSGVGFNLDDDLSTNDNLSSNEWIIDPDFIFSRMRKYELSLCSLSLDKFLNQIKEKFKDVNESIFQIYDQDHFDVDQFNEELKRYAGIITLVENYTREMSWYNDDDFTIKSMLQGMYDLLVGASIKECEEAPDLISSIEDDVNDLIDYLSTKKEYINELKSNAEN
jgi:predicted glutamine amidotransferase